MLPAINIRGNMIGPPRCTIAPLTLHELRAFEVCLLLGRFIHDFHPRDIWSSDLCLVCVAHVFPHDHFLTLSSSMAFIHLIFMKNGIERVPNVRQDEQMRRSDPPLTVRYYPQFRLVESVLVCRLGSYAGFSPMV